MEVSFDFFFRGMSHFYHYQDAFYCVIRSVSEELGGRTADEPGSHQFLGTDGGKACLTHIIKNQALLSSAYLSKCDLISASSYFFHVSEQDLILCMCIFRVITGLIQRNPSCWQFLSNYHCPVWETLSLCFSLRLCITVCFIFSEELALQYF